MCQSESIDWFGVHDRFLFADRFWWKWPEVDFESSSTSNLNEGGRMKSLKAAEWWDRVGRRKENERRVSKWKWQTLKLRKIALTRKETIAVEFGEWRKMKNEFAGMIRRRRRRCSNKVDLWWFWILAGWQLTFANGSGVTSATRRVDASARPWVDVKSRSKTTKTKTRAIGDRCKKMLRKVRGHFEGRPRCWNNNRCRFQVQTSDDQKKKWIN